MLHNSKICDILILSHKLNRSKEGFVIFIRITMPFSAYSNFEFSKKCKFHELGCANQIPF